MFICLCHVPACVAYVVKEVASFRGGDGLGQLMGMVSKRKHTQATDL